MKILIFSFLVSSCTPTLLPLEIEVAEDVVQNVVEDIEKHESKK